MYEHGRPVNTMSERITTSGLQPRVFRPTGGVGDGHVRAVTVCLRSVPTCRTGLTNDHSATAFTKRPGWCRCKRTATSPRPSTRSESGRLRWARASKSLRSTCSMARSGSTTDAAACPRGRYNRRADRAGKIEMQLRYDRGYACAQCSAVLDLPLDATPNVTIKGASGKPTVRFLSIDGFPKEWGRVACFAVCDCLRRCSTKSSDVWFGNPHPGSSIRRGKDRLPGIPPLTGRQRGASGHNQTDSSS